MNKYKGQRAKGSVLQKETHLGTWLLDLPDDLITSILAHLNLRELAAMHMVSQRFNRLLSRPDPILRPYGSVEVLVDKDRKGSLPTSQVDR